MAEEKAVTLTPSQLKDLMVEMAREIRRPADLSAEEIAAAEQDKKMRADTAQLEIAKAANRRWLQEYGCDHNREDGTCAAVHVANMGLIQCQRCNALVYPEGFPGVEYG